jgi:hypothetical protein
VCIIGLKKFENPKRKGESDGIQNQNPDLEENPFRGFCFAVFDVC